MGNTEETPEKDVQEPGNWDDATRQKHDSKALNDFRRTTVEQFGRESIESGWVMVKKRIPARRKDGTPYKGTQERTLGYITHQELDESVVRKLGSEKTGMGSGSYILRPCDSNKNPMEGDFSMIELEPDEQERDIMEIQSEIDETKQKTKLALEKKKLEEVKGQGAAGNNTQDDVLTAIMSLTQAIGGQNNKSDASQAMVMMLQMTEQQRKDADEQRKHDQKEADNQRKHERDLLEKKIEQQRQLDEKKEEARKEKAKAERDRIEKEFKLKEKELDKRLEIMDTKVSDERDRNQTLFGTLITTQTQHSSQILEMVMSKAKDDRANNRAMAEMQNNTFENSLTMIDLLKERILAESGLTEDDEGWKEKAVNYLGALLTSQTGGAPRSSIKTKPAKQLPETEPAEKSKGKPMTPSEKAEWMAKNQPAIINMFIETIAVDGSVEPLAGMVGSQDPKVKEFLLMTPWSDIRDGFAKVLSEDKQKVIMSEQAEDWWSEFVTVLRGDPVEREDDVPGGTFPDDDDDFDGLDDIDDVPGGTTPMPMPIPEGSSSPVVPGGTIPTEVPGGTVPKEQAPPKLPKTTLEGEVLEPEKKKE